MPPKHRASYFVLSLLLLLLGMKTNGNTDFLMVCNDDATTTSDIYGLFKVVLTDECRDQSRLDLEDNAKCIFVALCAFFQKQIQDRGARCSSLRKRLDNQALGINALIPSSTPPFDSVDLKHLSSTTSAALGADYTVDIDLQSPLLSFIPLTSTTVLWTTVVLLRPSTADGRSVLTLMPNAMFTVPISLVSASSIVMFADTLSKKKGGKLSSTGLIIAGCSVPSFTVRLEWQQTIAGCWRRILTIKEARELSVYGKDASQRRCFMPFDLDQLRFLLLTQSQAKVSQMIQSKEWGTGGVLFPLAYAETLLQCASTGTWYGQQTIYAGICVSCVSMYAKKRADGFRVRTCNHSVAADAKMDCCLGCISTMIMLQNTQECVERCRPGNTLLQSGYGKKRCTPCAAGLYSHGDLSLCVTCSVLMSDPNSWLSPSFGCKRCGSQAFVSSSGCVACDTGKYVSTGGSICHYCPNAGYFYRSQYKNISTTTSLPQQASCVACAPGTYSPSSSSPCAVCSRDTFAPLSASTTCHTCPLGNFSGVGSTGCVSCTATLYAFAEYFQSGCGLRCMPKVSYLRSSPYAPNGCGSCTKDIVLPIGSYPKNTDCTIALPCAPILNAHFTTAGSCAWGCNAGFYLTASGCTACDFGPGFSKDRHRPTGKGCEYTCQPYFFVDPPQLQCDIPCVDLTEEAAAGRIFSRIGNYDHGNTNDIPNYVQGVCGTNDTLPRAEIRPLRLGRWAKKGETIANNLCGNSFFNKGEECDDGNRAAGDGCSAHCKIEKMLWDCDLIGAPCVPNCGWSITSPAVNGVGLYGYVLPGTGACTNLSYRYNVEPLSHSERSAWMKANLINCDCSLRTLPYAECTALNGGCRQCQTGYYHDDLYGKCVACGGACGPGFMASDCVPAIAPTGCVPCNIVSGGMGRYVRGCKFVCANGYFCRNGGGEFCSSSQCGSCASTLQMIKQNPTQGTVGMYPHGCMDGPGYTWANCNLASKPAVGGFWTGNSPTTSDMDCPWSCSDTFYPWHGLCLPCFIYLGGTAPCKSGERLEWCPSTSGRATCLPCIGTPPGPYQVIHIFFFFLALF